MTRIKTICGSIFTKENVKPIVLFVALMSFCWFAIFGDQGLYQLHKTRKLKEQTVLEINSLKTRLSELKHQKELLSNQDHLELVIRKELGYVKAGETVFQQIGP